MHRMDTPNRIVARNLRRARQQRNWTQDEAAERLEPYNGERWSRTTFSAAERANAARVRKFDADLLMALSLAFELPITFFLATDAATVHVGTTTVSRDDYAATLAAHEHRTPLDLRIEARYHEKRAKEHRKQLKRLEPVTVADHYEIHELEEAALQDEARAEVLIEEARRLEGGNS